MDIAASLAADTGISRTHAMALLNHVVELHGRKRSGSSGRQRGGSTSDTESEHAGSARDNSEGLCRKTYVSEANGICLVSFLLGNRMAV